MLAATPTDLPRTLRNAGREPIDPPKERGRPGPGPRNDLARAHPVAMSVSEWTSPPTERWPRRTEPRA
jgi:hypothetical protein